MGFCTTGAVVNVVVAAAGAVAVVIEEGAAVVVVFAPASTAGAVVVVVSGLVAVTGVLAAGSPLLTPVFTVSPTREGSAVGSPGRRAGLAILRSPPRVLVLR
jgi:hypothetical protein